MLIGELTRGTRLTGVLSSGGRSGPDSYVPIDVEDIVVDDVVISDMIGELLQAPPISFQSAGSALLDYVIYGADGGVGDLDTETGKYLVPVTVRGKNLYNKVTMTEVPYYATVPDGVWSQQTLTFYSVIVPCSPNTTYTVTKMQTNRFRLATYERLPVTEDAPIAFYRGADTGTVGTINSGNGANFLSIMLYHDQGGAWSPQKDAVMASIQVEEGTESTGYEPYFNRTVTLSLDAPLLAGDSVSFDDTGVEIPANVGSNTLTVGTAVQPAEVYIKYSEMR